MKPSTLALAINALEFFLCRSSNLTAKPHSEEFWLSLVEEAQELAVGRPYISAGLQTLHAEAANIHGEENAATRDRLLRLVRVMGLRADEESSEELEAVAA